MGWVRCSGIVKTEAGHYRHIISNCLMWNFFFAVGHFLQLNGSNLNLIYILFLNSIHTFSVGFSFKCLCICLKIKGIILHVPLNY